MGVPLLLPPLPSPEHTLGTLTFPVLETKVGVGGRAEREPEPETGSHRDGGP